MSVAAILMASGFSRRFGEQNKLLFPLRGKPLARHTLELTAVDLADSFLGGIFFVTACDKVGELAKDLSNVKIIKNNSPEKGTRESVRLGIEAALEADYYFIFPCDQPFLDVDTVRRMLEARCPGCIVEACYKDLNGNLVSQSPSLFCASFKDELVSVKEGEKPSIVKVRHSKRVIRVEADESVLQDIDEKRTLETIK